MNGQSVRVGVLLVALLLVGCRTTWESLDSVVLPRECKPSSECRSFSFSPQLDQVLYKCDSDWWLASLPSLDDARPIRTADGASDTWSMLGWMPDGETLLVRSHNLTGRTDEWWLVKVDDLDDRSHLCTLPSLVSGTKLQRVPI